jgi:hypothetical protein
VPVLPVECCNQGWLTPLGSQRFRCRHGRRRFTRAIELGLFGRLFAEDIIALAVRWSERYRLSYAEVTA